MSYWEAIAEACRQVTAGDVPHYIVHDVDGYWPVPVTILSSFLRPDVTILVRVGY